MSDSIKYNLHEMEEFRVGASKAAHRVGSIGDDLASVYVAGSDFGTTPGATTLANAVTSMLGHLGTQFTSGEQVLQSVSRAMDGVMTAVEEADKAGKLSFDKGKEHTGGSVHTPSGGSGGSGGGSGGGGGGGGTQPASANPNSGTAPPVNPGSGVKINLPKGLGTVEAPNARAAGAVRDAISQLGVPYVWGGSTPGKGFDCSGLTQWAYAKEGISLPHDAKAQNIGERVSQENLAPGDLVVWNGHVAMYIGKGQMIEAPHTGDVVHVVPLRTSNAGDAFEGFYRPSVKG